MNTHELHVKYCPRSIDMLDAAELFAAQCHAPQFRKYTGEHYIVHPRNVARIVMETFPDVDCIAAAYLHDVVEDCGVSVYTIADRFGPHVARLVSDLTDVSGPDDGNRAARKAMDREHTAYAAPLAKMIKLADLLDNTCSITRHDAGFAKVYLAEKLLLLPCLREGNEFLHEVACLQVEMYMGELS